MAWCFQCYGFFCLSDDQKIHNFGIFKHHERDYDSQSFATYASQKAANMSIDEMLKAAGRLPGLNQALGSAVEQKLTQKFGNLGNGLRGRGSATSSGAATPRSAQGLSALGGSIHGSSSAGVCLLHGKPFTHFCQEHFRVTCEQCMEELESMQNASLGHTCKVQELLKTSRMECTKSCRQWLSRRDLFGAISKLRKQIDAEIRALNELLGNGVFLCCSNPHIAFASLAHFSPFPYLIWLCSWLFVSIPIPLLS